MNDNERNQYVIHCMIKRFSDKEALAYLKSMGYEMSSVTYWRIRKSIIGNRFKRIQEIADHELIDQHLERIDELLLIKKEMWSRYHRETSNVRAFEMLVDLANIQPAISQYYATTHMVIEKQHVTTKSEQQEQLTNNNSKEYEEKNNYQI